MPNLRSGESRTAVAPLWQPGAAELIRYTVMSYILMGVNMQKFILKSLIILGLLFVSNSHLYSQEESLNYYSENITFQSDSVNLAGTLTIPNTGKPFPALVLISGGGNRNRDAQYGKFKPFKLISEYLSSRGFVVLRFDDRGVGESTGQNSLEGTLDDFKVDALSAVKYLKSRELIDSTKIGLLGHCAGAYACLKAILETDDVSYLITMAGYGLEGVETLLDGTRRGLVKDGMIESEIKEILNLEKQLYDAMFTHRNFFEIEQKMRARNLKEYEKLSVDKRKKYKDFNEYFTKSSDSYLLKYAKTNYFLEVLKAEPIQYYENLNIPSLLLFGENDLSVHPDTHILPIISTFKNSDFTDYTIKVIPDANHYFVAEWSSQKFASKFLPTLYDWLEKTIQ